MLIMHSILYNHSVNLLDYNQDEFQLSSTSNLPFESCTGCCQPILHIFPPPTTSKQILNSPTIHCFQFIYYLTKILITLQLKVNLCQNYTQQVTS